MKIDFLKVEVKSLAQNLFSKRKSFFTNVGQKVVVLCRLCITYGVSYLKGLFRMKKKEQVSRALISLAAHFHVETFASFHERKEKEKNPPEGCV